LVAVAAVRVTDHRVTGLLVALVAQAAVLMVQPGPQEHQVRAIRAETARAVASPKSAAVVVVLVR